MGYNDIARIHLFPLPGKILDCDWIFAQIFGKEGRVVDLLYFFKYTLHVFEYKKSYRMCINIVIDFYLVSLC